MEIFEFDDIEKSNNDKNFIKNEYLGEEEEYEVSQERKQKAFEVIKIQKLPQDLEDSIECSRHHAYEKIGNTRFKFICYKTELEDLKLKKIVSSSEHTYASIDYNVLNEIIMFKRTISRGDSRFIEREFNDSVNVKNYILTSKNYPSHLFAIVCFGITADCNSCDGETSSYVTIMVLLISHLTQFCIDHFDNEYLAQRIKELL